MRRGIGNIERSVLTPCDGGDKRIQNDTNRTKGHMIGGILVVDKNKCVVGKNGIEDRFVTAVVRGIG